MSNLLINNKLVDLYLLNVYAIDIYQEVTTALLEYINLAILYTCKILEGKILTNNLYMYVYLVQYFKKLIKYLLPANLQQEFGRHINLQKVCNTFANIHKWIATLYKYFTHVPAPVHTLSILNVYIYMSIHVRYHTKLHKTIKLTIIQYILYSLIMYFKAENVYKNFLQNKEIWLNSKIFIFMLYGICQISNHQ